MESLVLYDYETITALSGLDLGAVAPSSSADTMMRVFNTSDMLQAEDVVLSLSGADAGQLWLSYDGDSFATSLQLGDIPPSALSATFWLRRVTASTTTPGACSAALNVTPTAWTHPVDTSTSINIALDTEGN